MELKKAWEKYQHEITFNISNLPEDVKKQGVLLDFAPKSLIISRGEFPKYIYFIYSGTAIGIRDYEDGNEYEYFQIDKENGNIGLLEVLARKEQYIATIMCITDVKAIRIEADYIYDLIMSDITMLRRCTVLLADDLYMRSGNDGILYYLKGLNRVRYYLVNYYDKHKKEGERVIFYGEYQEIANKIGISIRTVGRSIKKLKDAGEISSNNKKIVITETQYQTMLINIEEKLNIY
ncbi:Crp/Fnr family transcriptional regulator [uncultured Clostridium sp.]|uniref:Crp/Fnr family transcriptional regulator n=1 Tax=uncultured Clostridium sp. TaxID=59620 RepID=UPI0028EF1574|nr:Crp/Fnr family transcriptional regulator [uncultured Clostridium sp.]